MDYVENIVVAARAHNSNIVSSLNRWKRAKIAIIELWTKYYASIGLGGTGSQWLIPIRRPQENIR